MEAIGEQGELDLSMTRPLGEVHTGYSRFRDGDVVVAKITPCFENGKGALIRNTRTGYGYGTTELHVLTPGEELDARFLYYATVQPAFRRLGEAAMTGAAGQQRVPEDFVHDFNIATPSLSQQSAIADYLDRETARIDSLIAAKELVVALLTEKRRALINWAVIRGLNRQAPLRQSGIPWLGEIPAHWQTRRIAWLFRERDERGEPELPLLEVSINSGVVLREFSDEHIETTAADFNTYKVARRDDVVFNKMRMWQGAVGIAPEDGLVSPDYVVAAPTGPLTPAYAHLLFRTFAFSAECARHSHGIVWDRLRLYWEGFREIEVPLPTSEEQIDIVEFLGRETEKIDNLRIATERTIELLKERRGAVIAAAVTGQIDVGAGTS
jgi:type I restriction enzyme S subunit